MIPKSKKPLDEHGQCCPEVLARNQVSSIAYCRHCRVFNLCIGPMSFRMEGQVLLAVCHLLTDFQRELVNGSLDADAGISANASAAMSSKKH